MFMIINEAYCHALHALEISSHKFTGEEFCYGYFYCSKHDHSAIHFKEYYEGIHSRFGDNLLK